MKAKTNYGYVFPIVGIFLCVNVLALWLTGQQTAALAALPWAVVYVAVAVWQWIRKNKNNEEQ